MYLPSSSISRLFAKGTLIAFLKWLIISDNLQFSMKKMTISFLCELAMEYVLIRRRSLYIYFILCGSEVIRKNQFAIKCLFAVGREGRSDAILTS